MSKPDLLNYLQTKSKGQFDLKNNNCIQFTNDCWLHYHGHYWCKEIEAYSAFSDAPWSTPLEAADSILQRTTEPVEGNLVVLECKQDTYLMGFITGFCLGDLSVFLNNKGLRYLPTKLIKYSWEDKNDI